MEFEWDEDKRAANLDRHGIDFFTASLLFDGRAIVTRASARQGEDRWISTGRIDHRYVTLAGRGERVASDSFQQGRHGGEKAHRDLHG